MKKIIFTTCVLLLSMAVVQAQDKKEADHLKENIHVVIKEDATPDIYVDGKKFDFPMELIDASKIESIHILNGEKAMEEYNTTNEVILIATKYLENTLEKIPAKEEKENNDKFPMVILNGEHSDRETLKNISPDDIDNITIVKGEEAMEKYKAANGVIIIKTKKKKRK